MASPPAGSLPGGRLRFVGRAAGQRTADRPVRRHLAGGPGRRVPEVGYLLGKEFWGRGYAIEAARACKEYAFDTLGFDQVYSIIRDSNLASQRVAIRNGMLPRDRIIKPYYHQEMPHVVFSVRTREDGGRGIAYEPFTQRGRPAGAPYRPPCLSRKGKTAAGPHGNPYSFAHGLNFYKLVWIFTVGCLIGFAVETVWCYVQYGHFESRKGLIYGPFSPVYGFGAVLLTLALYPCGAKTAWRFLPPARLSARLLNSCAPGCRKGVRHHLLGVQRHPP